MREDAHTKRRTKRKVNRKWKEIEKRSFLDLTRKT